MKLGWWRDRGGRTHEVVNGGGGKLWRSTKCMTWGDDGSYWCDGTESEYDLIEFIRPLEDLPPALNSAVKAAEDMVRRLEAQYHAAQRLANEACENMHHAQRELERLEKECEVSK